MGSTLITISVETYVRRGRTGESVKVTEGSFVYVALDPQGRPRPVPAE